jgi:chemotaxis protein MotB
MWAHHGGAWKIALADFMTALMALFLVLWIISTASPAELQGPGRIFPHAAESGAGGRRP